jgi:predicted Holliday junction resolvase-like endonuclease
MIYIIFISLVVTLFLIRYFENKRIERLQERHEKRRNDFEQLLEKLKENKNETNET